jgi:hypothetical protein
VAQQIGCYGRHDAKKRRPVLGPARYLGECVQMAFRNGGNGYFASMIVTATELAHDSKGVPDRVMQGAKPSKFNVMART